MLKRVYSSLNYKQHYDYVTSQYKVRDHIGHENFRRTIGCKPVLVGQFQRMQSNPKYLVHSLIGHTIYDGEKFDEVQNYYVVRLSDQKVLQENNINA